MDLKQLIEDLQSTEISASRPRLRTWEPFMRTYGFNTICEIGVRDGMNFKKLIAHEPKLAVAVDCWTDDGVLGHNDICLVQKQLDDQYETFKSEMADKPFVKIYKGYSFDVVKEFEDGFFDFIYIDADHTYEGVKRDLEDWWPKVREGGLFCGHDYKNKTARTVRGPLEFGVARSVDEFVSLRGLSLFTAPNQTWGVVK